MGTIPASELVSVTPGVLSAGGSALALVGLALTNSTRVPLGTVQSFPDQPSVADYFGGSSHEAAVAGVYFAGYDNSPAKPGSMLFTQYNAAAVSAYLRGGSLADMTLAELQALTGELDITVDGYAYTAADISLSSATSFSSAATIIASALATAVPTTASFTAAISATTMTVSVVASGTLAVGQTVTGDGVAAGTMITALGSGTGGTGTYTVNNSQSVASESMNTTGTPPAVTFDSVSEAFVITSALTGTVSSIGFGSNTLATDLFLTSVTGAVTSQGAAATTPAAFMTALIQQTTNWASFFTTFNPDESGNANKLAFAEWNSEQDDEFVYLAWDTDASPTASVPATGSLGYLVKQASYSGTVCIYEPSDLFLAAFISGAIASIDFSKTNGRTTFAFLTQAGLTASVTNALVASNLLGNNYNFLGAYASGANQWVNWQNGSVSGPFAWLDSYVNQIQLNSQFQIALMNLLTSIGSLPYNDDGNALIAAALNSPINAALNFGTIRSGVALSSTQAAEVNNAAGTPIDSILSTRGWYLQIGTASASVRAARGTPPMTFWYTDGGSVQKIDLASINIQ